jgi:hypothetical protein
MDPTSARSDLGEVLDMYLRTLDKIVTEATLRRDVVRAELVKLRTGELVNTLNTMFGVTDLANLLNTASRHEGRVWERFELAHEEERATK